MRDLTAGLMKHLPNPGGRQVPWIVGEIGQTPAGDVDTAIELVQQVAHAGCWGVKLQALTPGGIASPLAEPYWHTTRHADTQAEAFQRAGVMAYDDPAWPAIFNAAHRAKIVAFATPFDTAAVDMLEDLGAPCYKIASGDITNVQLLERVAKTGRPVILSCGAATRTDVDLALRTLHPSKVLLLACTLTYPTPNVAARFGKIDALRDLIECWWPTQVIGVGYSDHTLGTWAAGPAVHHGAVMLEKHVTIANVNNATGRQVADDDMALQPSALRVYVETAQWAAEATGSLDLEAHPSEADAYHGARRSLFATKNIPAGTVLNEEHVASLRPLVPGAEPAERWGAVMGMTATRDLTAFDPILPTDIR